MGHALAGAGVVGSRTGWNYRSQVSTPGEAPEERVYVGVCVLARLASSPSLTLQPGHGKRGGPLHVPSCDSTDRGPVVMMSPSGRMNLSTARSRGSPQGCSEPGRSPGRAPAPPSSQSMAARSLPYSTRTSDVLHGAAGEPSFERPLRSQASPATSQAAYTLCPSCPSPQPPGAERSWLLATPTSLFTWRSHGLSRSCRQPRDQDAPSHHHSWPPPRRNV